MKKPSFLKWSAVVASVVAAAELFTSVVHADEMRALWVDAFGNGFLNSSQVTQLVSDCRTYNFNAVIVQVRRRADAFYIPQAPNLDPRTTALAANYDALQEIINQCNTGSPRIEVHVWAPANLVWSDTTKSPPQASHVFNTHPEYLTQTSGGVNQFAEGYFLDPGNPDAMTWNYNMAKDIVSRYDIDGFHWDYIRYPQQDSGYNPVAIARYNAEFGLTGQPSPSSSQFSTWRRRQVTDFVRSINADLLAIRPSLMTSASVFGSRSDALNARFQDWSAWNNEGIIDIAFPMIYSADNTNVFIPRMNDAFNNQGVRRIYVGLGAYLNVKENTVTQLNLVRNKGFLGSSFFSYRTPNVGTVDQADTFEYIRSNYQPTWQDTPALPWMATPTKGLVKGTVTRQDGGDPLYNATVNLTGSTNRTQRSEAHGKFALFEVTPGTYNVFASSGGALSSTSTVTVAAGGIYTVDMTINLPAVPDNTAPTISDLRVVSVTSNSCVLSWTTDESSDSTVEYGVTSTYGASTNNSTRVVNHTVTLSGLEPATTYQYRALSSDAAGNASASANQQFTTAPTQSDLIVDTQEATVVGPWTLQTTATDKFGADYRFRGKGTGANYLQFNPQFAISGNYQVFEWHSAGANRATNVPVVVTSLAGTQTYFVNQQTNGGKWNYVGTTYFMANAGGNVRITDGFADTNASRVVMADAVRFIYLPNQPVSDIIVDNPAAVLTGAWSLQTTALDKFGSNYLFRSRSTNGANSARFTPNVAVSGDYQVYEWHPVGSNRGLNVPHVITHSTGTQSLPVNQQINGGRWNLIGTFGFTAGSNGSVRITDGFATPTNGVVMADAIRLAYVPPPAPPAPPSDLIATVISATQINLQWTVSASGLNFVVARSQVEGGPYDDIATVPANITTYSDTSVTAAKSYFYVVRSVGIGGPSNNSGEASATTLPLAPAAPSDLAASASSSSQIDLSWTDNDGNSELVFILSRSSSASGPFADVANIPARVTSYSDTGLSPVTAYFYQLRAQNSGGVSDNSNVATATTLSDLPAAPSQVFANATAATRVLVTWTDNASNEDSVIILRDAGNGFSAIATLVSNSTSYADETVTAHNTYSYIVRASNYAGYADSASATANTPNTNPSASAAANNATAGVNCDATVVLDGSASSDIDGDTLTHTWTGSFGTVTGVTPSVTLSRGSHVITLTVDDGFGGTASAEVTVVVSDTTAPALTLNGTASVIVECHSTFVDAGASALDNCSGDLTGSVTVTGSVNANAPGTYTLTYSVTDEAGNSATLTRTVTVVDTTAPVLTLNGPASVIVECHSTFVDAGASASDSCSGNLTGSVTITGSVNGNAPGTYTLTYSVTDEAGNSATVTRTVTVVDTTAPVLTLNGPASVIVECHSTFVDAGASASDSCSGNLTGSVTITGSVNANAPGTYTLTYSVTDASGNASSTTRTVTVVDTTAPVISSLTASVYYLAPVNHTMRPVTLSAAVSDACDSSVSTRILAITSSQPDNGTGDGNTTTDFRITGLMTCELRAEREGSKRDRVYTVTVESIDDAGNRSTRSIAIIAPHDNRTSE